jgi:hypothetical protein
MKILSRDGVGEVLNQRTPDPGLSRGNIVLNVPAFPIVENIRVGAG